jgi:hypothetical protein
MVRDRRWGSDEAVEDDVGEGLQEGGSVALVAVAEEGVHKHRRHHPPSRATPRCPARTWPVAGVRSTRPGSCRHWPGRTIRAAAPERRQGLAPTTGPAATLLRSPADVSPTPMGTAGSRWRRGHGDDTEAVHAELLARGVDADLDVVHVAGGPPMFTVRDPAGKVHRSPPFQTAAGSLARASQASPLRVSRAARAPPSRRL